MRVAPNIVLLLTLMFFGLQINLASGFYIYDLIILIFCCFHFLRRPSVKYSFLVILSFVSAFALLGCLSSVRAGSFNTIYFLISYKIVIGSLYLYFFRALRHYGVSTGYGCYALFLPIILSMFMYFSVPIPFANIDVAGPYGLDPLRFGGVFGRDVVTFGAYAGIVAIFILYLAVATRSYIMATFMAASLLAFATLTSLSRTGMAIFVVGLVVIALIKFRKTLKAIVPLASFGAILAFVWMNQTDLSLSPRFSFDLLLEHMFDPHSVHVGAMYVKYFNIWYENSNITNMLFGMDVEWVYSDSLYLFIFGIHGLTGFLCFLVLIWVLKFPLREDRSFHLFVSIIIFALSYKGLFVFSNYFMFMLFLTYQYLLEKKYDITPQKA